MHLRSPAGSSLLALCALLLAAGTARAEPSDADFAREARRLERRAASLPGEFTVLIEKPFVVLGDGDADDVRAFATGTLRWAVQRLQAQYFQRRPRHVLAVWLFKDARSYEANARRLFKEKPDTPYGYYSPSEKALVMNIATGGGTLIHELVHPYMEANFPNVPPWFNEGMGSLYEQSSERRGQIVGLTNWRLAGLKEAITERRLPSFRGLMAKDEDAFYGRGSGDFYAQSRYLLYYLQERGLLSRYYALFRARARRDPTGFGTLRAVLGLRTEREVRRFEAAWKAWVMKLRFG